VHLVEKRLLLTTKMKSTMQTDPMASEEMESHGGSYTRTRGTIKVKTNQQFDARRRGSDFRR
jgi:hypothetical protein